MLDVSKLHFILANCNDYSKLLSELKDLCQKNNIDKKTLNSFARANNTQKEENIYDDKEVIFFKRVLQHLIPENIRHEIISILFKKYVGINENEFAEKLYLSMNDIKELIKSGMFVGGHGYRHVWMNKETYDSQEKEINLTLEFLNKVGAPTKNWIMCYPFGEYNSDTLKLLKMKECAIGLTVKNGFAYLNSQTQTPLTLHRFDTNAFPQ